jgi:hypothetical protein
MEGTIRHQVAVDHVLAAAHTPDPVDPVEWEGFLASLRLMLQNEGRVAVLVRASGQGGPDVNQRASLSALGELGEVKMAVLTESALLKGAVMALRWMNAIDVQAFSPEKEDFAVRHLGLDAEQAGRTLALLHQLSDRCARSDALPAN